MSRRIPWPTYYRYAIGRPVAWGSDGNLWFAERDGFFGKLSPAGALEEFPLKTISDPTAMVRARDGNLWLTEFGFDVPIDVVGRLTPDGELTEYAIDPQIGVLATALTVAPDGRPWFLMQGYATEHLCFGAGFGWVDPNGSISGALLQTVRPLLLGAILTTIAAAPDGRVLVGTDPCLAFVPHPPGPGLTVLNRDGSLDESIETGVVPNGIAVDTGGSIWFTNVAPRTSPNYGQIGNVDAARRLKWLDVPTKDGGADVISAGPDGAVWFAECAANRIGRIDNGVIVEYPLPSDVTCPSALAFGPDGNLWVVTFGPKSDVIVRMSMPTGICRAGDVNVDGKIDVNDVFALLNHQFLDPAAPICNRDVNGDGKLDVFDVFYLVAYLFEGGPAPR